MIQVSHAYMTTGKAIYLIRWGFVSKLMSLLLNMLSRFIIAFLPSSKRLLTSRLQSPYAVNLEPKKVTSVTVSMVSPSICHEVMGPDAMIIIASWLPEEASQIAEKRSKRQRRKGKIYSSECRVPKNRKER